MSKDVLIRNVPDELVDAVDAFARDNSGLGGKPSRNTAIQVLIQRGLASPLETGAVVRGDMPPGVTRES